MDTAAQVGEVLNGLQTAAAVIGQQTQRRCHEITERLATATPYSTTHLVEIGETEVVSIVNEDGVGVRYVYTVLNDGC